MSDIEKIEADIKSIRDAQRCLESMKSIRDDREAMMDFQMMWTDMQILAGRLQRKLDRLKNEGGAIVTNPKWEIGPVKLIVGNEAIIDAINEDQEDFRYVGRQRLGSTWMPAGWHACGRMMYATKGTGLDLAPPPKKTVRVQRYVNVFEDGCMVSWPTREEADGFKGGPRFACIEIDREVTEGEGL